MPRYANFSFQWLEFIITEVLVQVNCFSIYSDFETVHAGH